MRSTKVCSNCGWVLDYKDLSMVCPICKTKFVRQVCIDCGKPEVYRDKSVCYECYIKRYKHLDPIKQETMRRRTTEIYQEWLEKVAAVPKTYPVLTEAQWQETVKYFDGCACCDSESVDAKGYFVVFADGGRYCDWNIIPMCEACATECRRQPNYWKHLWKDIKPEKLLHIVDYLEPKLNAAIGEKE